MSEHSVGDTDRPMCDHGDHYSDGERTEQTPAVSKHEGLYPPDGPTFEFWACAEHAPSGPALERIDPGPENRAIDTGSE